MKSTIISFIFLSSLLAAPIATAQDAARKSHQELEIMKGILSTTLGFIAEEARGEARSSGSRGSYAIGRSFGTSSISAFYLRGQGAVFFMPMSRLRSGIGIGGEELLVAGELEFAEARERIELQREQAELQRARAEDLARSVEAEKAAGAEKARTASQENYRKALREYQDKVKERRKASELREKAYQELLTQAKMHLIEAIANHGDSLTHVKPEEYINLVLTSGRGGGAMLIGELYGDTVEYASAGSRTGREIISVQKSYITDYKAGRLTLEGFKQKVLQYFD